MSVRGAGAAGLLGMLAELGLVVALMLVARSVLGLEAALVEAGYLPGMYLLLSAMEFAVAAWAFGGVLGALGTRFGRRSDDIMVTVTATD